MSETELIRLGEFVWELILRLGDRYLPPQLEEAASFSEAWSGAPTNFQPLGQSVRDVYAHMGGKHHQPPFLEGRLFWQALGEAIAFLFDERKNRVVVIDGDGVHPEPAPAPRTIPLEYIAQYIIVGTLAEGGAAPSRREREARIRFSLTLDPLCADAYRIQGELDEGDGAFHHARIAYERAMQIAALLMGPDTIASAEASEAKDTDFWFASDTTRVYMRARADLARLFWRRLSDPRGAIAHFNALLSLDPGDHQDCRHALMCCLLEVGDEEELGALLARHRFYTWTPTAGVETISENITDTWWHYTHACRLFRMACSPDNNEAGLQEATQALYRAFQVNGYVPLLLLDPTRLSGQDVHLDSSPGSLGEAAQYMDMALSAWRNTPGALQWLEATRQSIQ